jgi:hypothetical protein
MPDRNPVAGGGPRRGCAGAYATANSEASASTPNDIIQRVSRVRIAILLRLQNSAFQLWA